MSRTSIECPTCGQEAPKGKSGPVFYSICQECVDANRFRGYEIGHLVFHIESGRLGVIYSIHGELRNIQIVYIGQATIQQLPVHKVHEVVNLHLAVLDGRTHREWPK